MNHQSLYQKNKQLLFGLMQKLDISDLEELGRVAGVSRWQLIRLQRGLILSMSVGTISKIAQALQMSIDALIETFALQSVTKVKPQQQHDGELAACRQEYEKLQQEMAQQKQSLAIEFQRASLETIESWLLQWPTAIAAVRKNPQLPAARLLGLVEPLGRLLQQWNLEAIAFVGQKLAYNPQHHQLMKGTAEPGELVEVRYVGYKQGDKLLYKAKVSPVEASVDG